MNILKQTQVYVIGEMPPAKRTLKIRGYFICLPFPWMVFKLNLLRDADPHYGYGGRLFCGFSQTSLTDKPIIVRVANLPNINQGNATVCLLGHRFSTADEIGLRNAIQFFWQSTFYSFNDWFSGGILSPNLATWSKMSLEEIVKVEWKVDNKARRTIEWK